jgi:hypothetical protein
MPATTRTPQVISRTGLAEAFTAADNTNGETCQNDGLLFLHVKNTGGGACTVSVAIPNLVDGQTVPSKTVVVPATTGDRMIGPFPTGQYNDSSGNIGVGYSTGTGVTAAYVHLG